MTISIQEFRVEPESIVYDRSYGWEPEDMVFDRASEYDWSYGLEPEDMVLEVRARGYDKSLGGSQRI